MSCPVGPKDRSQSQPHSDNPKPQPAQEPKYNLLERILEKWVQYSEEGYDMEKRPEKYCENEWRKAGKPFAERDVFMKDCFERCNFWRGVAEHSRKDMM